MVFLCIVLYIALCIFLGRVFGDLICQAIEKAVAYRKRKKKRGGVDFTQN